MRPTSEDRDAAPGPGNGGAPRSNTRSGGSSAGVAAGAGLLGTAVSAVAVWGAGALLVGVLLLLIWAVARGLLERETKPQAIVNALAGDAAPGDDGRFNPLPADERLAAARSAAAAGRYGEAVAILLNGLTDRVELAGLIRPRRGLTAREYLRAARPDPACTRRCTPL